MEGTARDNALLVVAICLTAITSIFLAARLWARFVKLRKVGLDDYTIIPAYVSIFILIIPKLKCAEIDIYLTVCMYAGHQCGGNSVDLDQLVTSS